MAALLVLGGQAADAGENPVFPSKRVFMPAQRCDGENVDRCCVNAG